MDEKTDIPGLIKSINEASGILPVTGYKVPDNYFEALPARILEKIPPSGSEELEPFPALSAVSKQMPFRVEKEYLESISAIDFFPVSNPYKVPEGYFENVANKTQDKVRSLKPLIIGNWKRLAIAASVLAVAGLAGIQYISYPTREKDAVVQTVVPQLETMDSGELVNFVQDDPEAVPGSKSMKKTLDDNQLFHNVSSQELKSFLNENIADENEVFFN